MHSSHTPVFKNSEINEALQSHFLLCFYQHEWTEVVIKIKLLQGYRRRHKVA